MTMRVHFRVEGACRYIPHTDLMRAFQRACRMARVPVRFTQGFSPRPRLAFGPPLPVGIGGEREVFDLELEAPVDDLAARLNGVLPEGLRCLGAVPVGKGRSLTAMIRAAAYRAELPGDLAGPEVDEALARFDAAGTFPVTKKRPGRPDRTIDLKRGVESVRFDRAHRRVEFRLAVHEPDGHETRAQTVLEAIFGFDREQAARVRVIRQAMYDAGGSVL